MSLSALIARIPGKPLVDAERDGLASAVTERGSISAAKASSKLANIPHISICYPRDGRRAPFPSRTARDR